MSRNNSTRSTNSSTRMPTDRNRRSAVTKSVSSVHCALHGSIPRFRPQACLASWKTGVGQGPPANRTSGVSGGPRQGFLLPPIPRSCPTRPRADAAPRRPRREASESIGSMPSSGSHGHAHNVCSSQPGRHRPSGQRLTPTGAAGHPLHQAHRAGRTARYPRDPSRQ
jgi:hypothetical protein